MQTSAKLTLSSEKEKSRYNTGHTRSICRKHLRNRKQKNEAAKENMKQLNLGLFPHNNFLLIEVSLLHLCKMLAVQQAGLKMAYISK